MPGEMHTNGLIALVRELSKKCCCERTGKGVCDKHIDFECHNAPMNRWWIRDILGVDDLADVA